MGKAMAFPQLLGLSLVVRIEPSCRQSKKLPLATQVSIKLQQILCIQLASNWSYT
jgi:hypothetical protein